MGENPWAQFIRAPTTVQLAIHALPLRFLPKMKRISSHISGGQSSTTKRPRLSQPGTLTRANILGSPSRPLRWLSPSSPTTLRPLLQASSSSPRRVRSNLASPQAAPPSVETEGKYGQATQRCPATHPTCPICGLHHTRSASRCQNPTCPRSATNTRVPSCSPTSHPPLLQLR